MAVISISRQFGAGGQTLANLLAQRLDYQLADHELVTRVVEAADVSDEWVRVTEREGEIGPRSRLSGLFDSDFLERFLGRSRSESRQGVLAGLFHQFIPEMAARDNIIFIGRGSQFLLPSGPNTLKVLLIADEEQRVAFLMDQYHLTRAESMETVKDWEKNRAAFLRQISPQDPNDPALYDLVFNMSRVRLPWVADLVCDLVDHRPQTAPAGA